jgi:hypothetical protein
MERAWRMGTCDEDACQLPALTEEVDANIAGILATRLQFRRSPSNIFSVLPIKVLSPARAETMPSPPGRAKHQVVGAFCVLLLLGGVAPSSTRASCGHGVTSGLNRAIGVSLSDLELARYQGAALADPAPADPRRDMPCSGPSCSKGRSLPHAPSSSSSPVRSDPWCCTSAAPGWASPEAVDTLGDLAASRPRHTSFRIDRPPRAAVAPTLY